MRSKFFVSAGLLLASAGVLSAQFVRPQITKGVRFDQRLNAPVPLDTVFRDEANQAVPLRTYFGDKPVVLALVYYKCPSLCNLTLTEMASARLASPIMLRFDQLGVGIGYDAKVKSWNFPRPWLGGTWRLRDIMDYEEAAALVAKRFPVQAVAVTLRDNPLVWRNGWTAIAWQDGRVFRTRAYEVEVVDRLGAGDSFAAGLIHGLLEGDLQKGVDYGVAASALKHSIPGDFAWVTRAEVEALLQGGGLRISR